MPVPTGICFSARSRPGEVKIPAYEALRQERAAKGHWLVSYMGLRPDAQMCDPEANHRIQGQRPSITVLIRNILL